VLSLFFGIRPNILLQQQQKDGKQPSQKATQLYWTGENKRGKKQKKKPTKESLTERSDTKFCVFYVYASSSTTGHSLLQSSYVSLTEDDCNHNSRSKQSFNTFLQNQRNLRK
jgi:hypothetical protein